MGGSNYVAKTPRTPGGVKRNVGIMLKKVVAGPQGPIIKKGTKGVVTFGANAKANKQASKFAQPIASAFSGASAVREAGRITRASAAAVAAPSVKRVRKPAPPPPVKVAKVAAKKVIARKSV